MGDRFHIIVTGENGSSSTFQFSRRKTFLIAAASSIFFISASIFGLYTGGYFFNHKSLSGKLDQLETELARNEEQNAVYLEQIRQLELAKQEQIRQLELAKQEQIESIKDDYEFKLSDQKVRHDLENTSLQLENVKLMNNAISDLNARSELIESVMSKIGVKIIKDTPETSDNSGGPFIPADEAPFEDLLKKVDKYLRTIKHMPLGRPIKGAVTSKYGKRTDPLNKKKGIHEGVDIRAKSGTKIRATADGVVVKAFVNGGYGNYVEIDHGNGYRTAYGHLKSYLVKQGETVERGQVIGLVGDSGRSTGPHLHYEIILHEKPVDPNKFMKVADLSHTLTGSHTDVQN